MNASLRALPACLVAALLCCLPGLRATDCNGNGIEDIDEVLRPVSAPNPPRWPAGESPRDIVSGDIDGDDDPDVVVADFARWIRVFRNEGGALDTAAEMAVSLHEGSLSGATSSSLVDVDRDGDLDLVAGITDWQAAHAYGALFTYENKGDGTFEEPAVQSLNGGLDDIEILDIDGDGAPDAAGWSREDRTLTIFENSGGELLTGGILDVEPAFLPFLSAADWNGDGTADLVLFTVGSTERVSLLPNLRGTFSDPVVLREGGVWTLAVDDLDLDGHPDLVVSDFASDALLVFRNVDGALSDPVEVGARPGALSIHIADLDADGRRDMALLLESDLVSLIEQDAPGAFGSRRSYFAGLLTGSDLTADDFDRDGLVDIALTLSSSRAVGLLRRRADGTYEAPRVVERSNREVPGLLAVGELTGDTSPDLIYTKVRRQTNEPIPIAIERNLGNGSFSSSAELEARFSPSGLELLDMDLDGDLDVARGVRGGGLSLGFHENLGEGAFDPAVWFASGGAMGSLHVGDYDDNGLPDVVMAMESAPGISVVLNDANGTFRPPILTPWPEPSITVPVFLLSGDFDGDAHLDILMDMRLQNSTYFYSGMGTGRFEGAAHRPSMDLSEAAGAADLDGDGDSDVLAANVEPMSLRYEIIAYVNDGAAGFAREQEISVPQSPLSILIADLNGDGRPEALVPCLGAQDIDEGAVAALRNDGAGRFSQAELWLAGYRPSRAALADIDADGSHDLLAATEGEFDDRPPGDLLVLDGVSRPPSGIDADGNLILDECQSPPFHRGDANGDGAQDISDPLCILNVLFVGRCRLDCLEAADANNDGVVDCSDPIATLNWLFVGGEPPALPGPDGQCGVDTDLRGSPAFLDCELYAVCP